MKPRPSAPEPFWLIAIAASAGGISAISSILAGLPTTIPAAIVIVQHRAPTRASILDRILARVTALPVRIPGFGDAIRPGCVYLARPDLHLTIEPTRRFVHVDVTRVRGVLSSANPLFSSAADVFHDRMIAVVLTGSGFDATDGVQTVKTHGGIVIVQDPATAQHSSMPTSAIGTGVVDRVLPLEAIAPALVEITGLAAAQGQPG